MKAIGLLIDLIYTVLLGAMLSAGLIVGMTLIGQLGR